jgi:hypothetical protein
VIAEDFVEPVREVLEANGVSFVCYGNMFDNYYGAASLLEGMVIYLTTYGFPAGRLSSGWRVLGYRPMRLLCLLMGLEPPRRRLLGEHSLAMREELLEDLSWQSDEPRAQVEERAKRGLGVIDRLGLLVLVRELFGEEYLPTPLSRDLKAALPAVSSRWALPGFDRLAEEELPAAGIDVAEAIAWRTLGLSRPHQMIEARPYGLRAIRKWVEAGFDCMQAVSYLAKGRTLDQLSPYVTAGRSSIDSYVDAGFATEYRDAGVDGPERPTSPVYYPTLPSGTISGSMPLRPADSRLVGPSIEARRLSEEGLVSRGDPQEVGSAVNITLPAAVTFGSSPSDPVLQRKGQAHLR